MDTDNNFNYNTSEKLAENLQKNSYKKDFAEKMKKKKIKNFHFIVGLIIIAFAIVGMSNCVSYCINIFTTKSNERAEAEINEYNAFLSAVAAVDPAPFDDITAAPMNELVEISVWSILSAGLSPEKYTYSATELLIPAEEVEKAFIKYFGTQVSIEHCTVTGYGYEFSYNPDNNAYHIPLTTIEPIYTPHVTQIESKSESKVLTLGLINSNAWQQNSKTGNMEKPDADKYMKVTLRTMGSGTYISAIQNTSYLETAIVEVFTKESTTNENTDISSESEASSEESTSTQ